MNNFFLITGSNYLEIKNFSILSSKALSYSKNKTLIINFNNFLWDFFNYKQAKNLFIPQKFFLKEYFVNVSEELFFETKENELFLKNKLKSFESKYKNIIFLIDKSNNWIYHFLTSYANLKIFELSNLKNISKSIELDILNKTKLPTFLISNSNFKNNSNEYYSLKKIYLNKIIPINIDLENKIENILLIPKKNYEDNLLKVIKIILNII